MKKAKFIAYAATNTVNGKRYIGITIRSLKIRWHGHLTSQHCRALSAAIGKYGASAFIVEEIACAVCRDDLLDLERMLIVQENTLSPNGYNLVSGGYGTFGASKETRELLRKAILLRPRIPVTLEMRATMSAAQKRRFAENPPTEEALKQHGARQKAAWARLTPEQREQRVAKTRKKRSPQACANISAGKIGKPRIPHSAESNLKRKISMTGKVRGPCPEERRQKISEGLKAWHAAQTKEAA